MPEKELLPSPKCLVLFSGGKDSFLSACYMIDAGYTVELISFNNGAVAGEENLLHGVKRMQNRYGEDVVNYAGVYCISSTIARLTDYWSYVPSHEFGDKYPNIINAQLTCLHCQTAMWCAAIAYACAKEIKVIVTGYRSTDVFCTGVTPWVDAMMGIARAKGITVEFPVWEKSVWEESYGWERDTEMVLRSFEPRVLEPKCLLGRPVVRMSDMQESDLVRYFKDNLQSVVEKHIEHLTPIFKTIKLSTKSLEVLHYDPPDGKEGIF